jgi:enamine deaminase RidA (YjgF/YER057c/UK114 family)
MQRINVSSGSPLEEPIGFSRAVRIGNLISVSATAPIKPDGTTAALGDVYGQTKYCLEIIKTAITNAGGAIQDVYRTRVMLTDISKWKEAARAHGELFGSIRPACSFFEAGGFVDKDWLVEIEADGYMAG